MAVIGLQSSIWSNRFKTVLLLFLFPAFLFLVFFLVLFLVNLSSLNQNPNPANTNQRLYLQNNISKNTDLVCDNSSNKILCISEKTLIQVNSIFVFLGPTILVWALISFLFHRQLIFSFTQAKPITRKDYPELYNIVENLCISRGLSVPNIGILEDDSLNAFAVGRNIKKSWIVFSRGIINKLNKQELEAVAGHELTHIINKDGLLFITIIVFIGSIASIGELLIRIVGNSKSSGNSESSGSSKSSGNLKIILLLFGFLLIVLGYIILPIVQLALSRKREYLADAGSVELTHDKLAMISALKKINQDSVIESIKKDSVSALCISNPFPKTNGIKNWFHEFFSTHPTIENRIEMLEKY